MNTNRVKVEKIVNGGYGLGRLENGQIVLLHNSIDGETVEYRVLEKRKKLIFAAADNVVIKNSERISPPCPYFNNCGGCNLQHCSYAKQLQIKDSIIEELLQGIVDSASIINPTFPSPQKFSYRQRIRLKVSPEKLGFLKFRSKEIVAVKKCLLAHPLINQVLGKLLETLEFTNLRSRTDELELLFNPETSQISCLIHFCRKPRPAELNIANKLVEKIEGLDRIFFCGKNFSLTGPSVKTGKHHNSKLLSQKIHLSESPVACTLSWEISGFCQVNLLQNINLVNYVLRKCGDVSKKDILDLFCGMGNFSIPLARSSRFLLGVEGQGAAIRCAKKNSSAAGLSNTDYIKGSIHNICAQLNREQRQFDITILDPPRQGVPGLTSDLISLTRERLVYISCDPATLTRDLTNLCDHGFSLMEIQPFDMFPQTHHIETVAVLEKN